MDMDQLRDGARTLEEATSEVRALLGEVPPDLAARIRDAHDRAMCGAHGEGLECCLDWLP